MSPSIKTNHHVKKHVLNVLVSSSYINILKLTLVYCSSAFLLMTCIHVKVHSTLFSIFASVHIKTNFTETAASNSNVTYETREVDGISVRVMVVYCLYKFTTAESHTEQT